MICPKCGVVNQQNNIKCNNCGTKFKIVCPKCKSTNPLGATRCIKCNLQFVRFCPNCKTANLPTTIHCRKCSLQLLKNCKYCDALNLVSVSKCSKCSKSFINSGDSLSKAGEIILTYNQKTSESYVLLSIEIINLKTLSTRINNNEILNKILEKFYQIIAKHAKLNKQLAKKINSTLMAIEFINTDSFNHSIFNSLSVSTDILNNIKEFNYRLKEKFNVDLKIKIGISTTNESNKRDYAARERNEAIAGEIVLNNELHKVLKSKFLFSEIISKVDGMSFYKYEGFIPENELEKEASLEQTSEATPEFLEEALNLADSFNLITDKIKNTETGCVLCVKALEGTGKSLLIQSILNNLAQNGDTVSFFGQASYNTQIQSFGVIKDILKTFFSLPALDINVDESKNNILDMLINKIGISDVNIQTEIINFIFPQGCTENGNISSTKENLTNAVQELLIKIAQRFKVVIVVEDAEFIDKASKEFLENLINNKLFDFNFKIVLTFNNIEMTNFIESPLLTDENNLTVTIRSHNKNEISELIVDLLNRQDIIPEDTKNQICVNSGGLPVFVEETILLLSQIGLIYEEGEQLKVKPEITQLNIPLNVEEVIKILLLNISQNSSEAYKIISYASLFGQKFIPALIKLILNLDDEPFNNALQLLLSLGIITSFDNFNYVFKNKTLWEVIHKTCINDEERAEYHSNIANVLINNIQTQSAELANHFELAKLYPQAFIYWNQAATEAFNSGDAYAYSFAKSKALKLLDFVDIENKEAYKSEANKKLGKLNYLINPKESVMFLSNAIIDAEKQNNHVNIVTLSGYMAKSCELLGNYAGVVECVDKAISLLNNETMKMEVALLKYFKLDALCKMGKYEEVVITAQNDVLPILKDGLAPNQVIEGLSLAELNYIILDIELAMVRAMAEQGNSSCTKMAEILVQKANAEGFTEIATEAQLILAFNAAFQGYTADSLSILESLKSTVEAINNNLKLVLHWNYIIILNKIISNTTANIESELNNIRYLAEKTNDNSIKIIAELLLTYELFQKDENNKDSSEKIDEVSDSYYELLNFCTENKLATGAMLAWYLLADTEFLKNNIDSALSICEKALDVANGANINNKIFVIGYQNLISKIYAAKADNDLAQIYAEKALSVLTENNLQGLKL